MSIDCTFYSTEKTSSVIDLDPDWQSQGRTAPCPTLTITHDTDGKAMHFMSVEQLAELRDLLTVAPLPPTSKVTNIGTQDVVDLMYAALLAAAHTVIGGRYEEPKGPLV